MVKLDAVAMEMVGYTTFTESVGVVFLLPWLASIGTLPSDGLPDLILFFQILSRNLDLQLATD